MLVFGGVNHNFNANLGKHVCTKIQASNMQIHACNIRMFFLILRITENSVQSCHIPKDPGMS